jgi:hypothetical protein
VILLGLDPGGDTGWALWEDHQFTDFGWFSAEAHHVELWQLLTKACADVIICESFERDADPASLLVSIEYIGTVKTFASMSATRLVMQGSAIKRWADDKKLRKYGVRHKNWYKERHAVDGERHVLYYLCHNKFVDPELQHASLMALF